jgi:hypothetical protein
LEIELLSTQHPKCTRTPSSMSTSYPIATMTSDGSKRSTSTTTGRTIQFNSMNNWRCYLLKSTYLSLPFL